MQNKKYLVANKNQIEEIQKLIVADENQIEVRQNAGDEASPLTCSPECPQVSLLFGDVCSVVHSLYHLGLSLIQIGMPSGEIYSYHDFLFCAMFGRV